jgi:hypothetical protein
MTGTCPTEMVCCRAESTVIRSAEQHALLCERIAVDPARTGSVVRSGSSGDGNRSGSVVVVLEQRTEVFHAHDLAQ